MEKKYLTLLDIEPYNVAYNLSNELWDIVLKWDYFSKDTIGKQFVRAMDSVSANIAEGFGRYHKKDKMKFYRYAKGSLYECVDWCKKAKARQLLSDEEFATIQNGLQSLPKQLNTLIKYTYETLKE